jgi:hypothetical protein
MPRRRPALTADEMESLREHFRRSPPSTARDFRTAAAMAGVTESEARRAWSRGFVGVEPIEQQLARERAIASQSVDVLRVEQVVRAAAANAQALQGEMLRLRPVVNALVESLAARADDGRDGLGPCQGAAERGVRSPRLLDVHRRVGLAPTDVDDPSRLPVDEAAQLDRPL